MKIWQQIERTVEHLRHGRQTEFLSGRLPVRANQPAFRTGIHAGQDSRPRILRRKRLDGAGQSYTMGIGFHSPLESINKVAVGRSNGHVERRTWTRFRRRPQAER